MQNYGFSKHFRLTKEQARYA